MAKKEVQIRMSEQDKIEEKRLLAEQDAASENMKTDEIGVLDFAVVHEQREFVDLKPNDVFVGMYKGDNDGANGLDAYLFDEYPSGKPVYMPKWHAITEFLDKHEIDNDKTVFKLTYLSKKEKKNNRSYVNLKLEIATLG